MQRPDGVLLVRDDGVIRVDRAVPVTPGLVTAVERVLDTVGAPRREPADCGCSCDYCRTIAWIHDDCDPECDCDEDDDDG